MANRRPARLKGSSMLPFRASSEECGQSGACRPPGSKTSLHSVRLPE